jgi:3,2-trans-enoyl-CoA isomerase
MNECNKTKNSNFYLFIIFHDCTKGIKAPFWFCDTMINTIGYRETEKALQLGKLYSDIEALKINLVDEIVEVSEVVPRAEEQIKIWLKIPVVARELTKSSMRRDIISKLLSQREADTNEFVDFTTKEYVQRSLGAYLESLKIRKSK